LPNALRREKSSGRKKKKTRGNNGKGELKQTWKAVCRVNFVLEKKNTNTAAREKTMWSVGGEHIGGGKGRQNRKSRGRNVRGGNIPRRHVLKTWVESLKKGRFSVEAEPFLSGG